MTDIIQPSLPRFAAILVLCVLSACRNDTAAVKQDREFNNRLGTMERIRTAYSDHVHREAKASLLPPKVLAVPSPPLPQVQEKPIIQTASFLSPGRRSAGAAMRQTKTTLVAFETAPFPYDGTIARTDKPFMNISEGGRRGHRTPFNRVYWEDETYNDPRVLLHIPRGFDIKRPAVMVLFFHGHGATLERDVHLRQEVPRQISKSGMNAILVAPQLAVDATRFQPGKFWEPGAVKRFLAEAATKLARLQGDPQSRQTFANMPVVIVAYSGGFLPPPGPCPAAASASACAASCCSTRSTARRTGSPIGSSTSAPASSSAPLPIRRGCETPPSSGCWRSVPCR